LILAGARPREGQGFQWFVERATLSDFGQTGIASVVDWLGRRAQMKRLILCIVFALATTAASAADTPKSSVFVKSACDGKISATIVASLKAQIEASPKYHAVPNLTDEGRMGEVLTIEVVCSERPDIVAIATTFGKSKCFPGAYCHGVVDGSSLKAALCDSNLSAECGRALFKAFDDYASHMNGPGAPQLQLH
jgi:hypothetical protein